MPIIIIGHLSLELKKKKVERTGMIIRCPSVLFITGISDGLKHSNQFIPRMDLNIPINHTYAYECPSLSFLSHWRDSILLKITSVVFDTFSASQLSVKGKYVLLAPTSRNAFL